MNKNTNFGESGSDLVAEILIHADNEIIWYFYMIPLFSFVISIALLNFINQLIVNHSLRSSLMN